MFLYGVRGRVVQAHVCGTCLRQFDSDRSPKNREPTLCKLFVVKFKLWSCSQPSLREDMVTEKCKEYIYNLNCEYED